MIVRHQGLIKYAPAYSSMAKFSGERSASTMDEIWFLTHPPVYTLGLAGKAEHIMDAGDIPVIRTDRGGQVTYHGPGQLITYLMLDLRRKGFGIKQYVSLLEQCIIDMLGDLGLEGFRRSGAPGVYIQEKKIAALGVRVRRGCCYHGLAVNVDMDLLPFQGINPCGYHDLEVTQLSEFGLELSVRSVADLLLPWLVRHLNYSKFELIDVPGQPETLSQKRKA